MVRVEAAIFAHGDLYQHLKQRYSLLLLALSNLMGEANGNDKRDL